MSRVTVDSKKLEEYEPGTICAGFPSSLGPLALGFGDSHIPTFWLLPQRVQVPNIRGI